MHVLSIYLFKIVVVPFPVCSCVCGRPHVKEVVCSYLQLININFHKRSQVPSSLYRFFLSSTWDTPSP